MIDFKQKMEESEKREQHTSIINEDENLLIKNKKRNKATAYLITAIVIVLVFSGKILMSSQNGTGWFSDSPFFNKLSHLVPSTDKKLQGEENDRVNILLLGMGGAGHDGAYLTDTIMLVSFKPSTKQLAMISIPRDLVSPVSNWRKINSVNALAEQKNPGSGGEATAQAISELLQTPIAYYVRADFSGFSNIIDQLGGVEVNVENSFDDYTYPANGQEDNPNYYARFEHLHFDKGLQTMDGETALKFARSRHALGPEGSDFARARRQQLILEAVKEKLLSSKTLLNPVTISKLANEFSKNISTNLSVWEILRAWELFKDVNRQEIINKVLSNAPDGLLVSGVGDGGAYILSPRYGNFSEIRTMVQNIFLLNAPASEQQKIEPITDNAKVLVLNGTWVSGLANKVSTKLLDYQFKILKTGNAPARNYTQSLIYDLTGGEKKNSLETLQKVTSATISNESPEWTKNYSTSTSTPDFLLILGTDANQAE